MCQSGSSDAAGYEGGDNCNVLNTGTLTNILLRVFVSYLFLAQTANCAGWIRRNCGIQDIGPGSGIPVLWPRPGEDMTLISLHFT